MAPTDICRRYGRSRPAHLVVCALAAALLFIFGCQTEPRLDKAKFTELNKAGQDLRAAISADDQCKAPEVAVERVALGTAALKDKAASKAERDLLAAYENLLTISRDAMHLCGSRGQLTGFQFVPKGRIYVSQDLDAIVERYDLATENHVYKDTGARWRSISADSIKTIWEKAEALLKSIEVVLAYG